MTIALRRASRLRSLTGGCCRTRVREGRGAERCSSGSPALPTRSDGDARNRRSEVPGGRTNRRRPTRRHSSWAAGAARRSTSYRGGRGRRAQRETPAAMLSADDEGRAGTPSGSMSGRAPGPKSRYARTPSRRHNRRSPPRAAGRGYPGRRCLGRRRRAMHAPGPPPRRWPGCATVKGRCRRQLVDQIARERTISPRRAAEAPPPPPSTWEKRREHGSNGASPARAAQQARGTSRGRRYSTGAGRGERAVRRGRDDVRAPGDRRRASRAPPGCGEASGRPHGARSIP